MSGLGSTPIYGPEPWSTKGNAVWSYWDLWLCVVALADHGGDLDALAAAIEDSGRSFWSETVESKLSHLDDLQRRLAETVLDARALAGREEADTRVRGKARTKVLRQGLYPRDLTDAMRHTPRDRLYERALRGRWHLFPISPEPSTSGSRTGSATGIWRRARRSGSSVGSTPRATGSTATRPRIRRRGSRPAGPSSPSPTGRWSGAMTPTA
jgi:hypothetical protein